MGESGACLVRSFSQPSSSCHESIQGDHMNALTSSISFGRYMNEPLVWDKWSAFTQNRYMEEVEKYSKPGSVAQMKAHFEAHYKKKAAERAEKKAAELKMQSKKENESPNNQNLSPKHNYIVPEKTQQLEDIQVEVTKHLVEPLNQLENVEDNVKIMSNQEIKDVTILGDLDSLDKKKCVYNEVPKPPAPPKQKVLLPKRRIINASPNCKKSTIDSTSGTRKTIKSVHMSIDFSSRETKTKTKKPLSPILQKISKSKLVKNLTKETKDKTIQAAPVWSSIDISKRTPVTPQRGLNRSRTPLKQSLCESGEVEKKLPSSFVSCLNSPDVRERKAQSPVKFRSFSFKSEERAAKRKEFFERLELNSKAKETEKVQLQAKLKEKARCDYKPIPKISQGTLSSSDTRKKGPQMRPCSPKLVRNIQSQSQEIPKNESQRKNDINSRPPWRLTAKYGGSKDTKGNVSRVPLNFSKSVSK